MTIIEMAKMFLQKGHREQGRRINNTGKIKEKNWPQQILIHTER